MMRSEEVVRDQSIVCRSCGIRFLLTAAQRRCLREAKRLGGLNYCPGCRALQRLRERRQGHVRWFDAARGFGFVRDDEGQDVFAHISSVIAGRRRFCRGVRVAYHLEPSDKGPIAASIIVLDDD